MTLGKTVMLFGLGDLGGWVLEFLVRQQGVSMIITLDTREQWGVLKTHSAATGAGHMGHYKTIKFEKCDIHDIDRTAELLSKYNPDFIYSSASLHSPTLPMFLSPELHLKLEKIDGHFIPAHLTLIYKLMKAVKESGITTPVLNHSWPDIINPMLWRVGLGPLVGAGNLDIHVAEIRRRISIDENIPIPEITIYYIAEHAVGMQGARTGIPYFLKIMIGDKDITNRYDTVSLVSEGILSGCTASQASWIIRPTIASCAVRLIMAILNDTNELTHAPGPNGLIGGYPIRAGAKGVEVVLPEEITLEEAIKINKDGAKHEGIEEIEDDGTLVITDEAYEIGKELLGISCREIKVADAEGWAKEVLTAYRKLADKYNAPLSIY